MSDPIEDAARQTEQCVCGTAKTIGNVVCWPCFKRPANGIPFKTFKGSYSEWITAMNACTAIILHPTRSTPKPVTSIHPQEHIARTATKP